MNNLDQLFKEKLQNHQLEPADKSREIFLKKAGKISSANRPSMLSIAAAIAVFLATALLFTFIFTTSNTHESVRTDPFVTAKPEVNVPTEIDSAPAVMPVFSQNEIASTAIERKPSKTLSESAVRETDASNALPLYQTDSAAIFTLADVSAEIMTNGSTSEISEQNTAVVVSSSGLFEQINHYSTQQLQQKNIAIRLPIVNQIIQVKSPLISEVEHSITTVKKEIREFNLADAGKQLTQQFSERLNLNKPKN